MERGAWGCRSILHPSPGRYSPGDCLPARVDRDVLDDDTLSAAGAVAFKRLDLHCICQWLLVQPALRRDLLRHGLCSVRPRPLSGVRNRYVAETETGSHRLTEPSDEPFVASILIAILADPDAKKPLVLEIFTSVVERCEAQVEELFLIDRRLMS